MKTNKLKAVLGFAVTMGFVGNVCAALIGGVTIEDFSHEQTDFGANQFAVNTINKSALGTDAGGDWHTVASHSAGSNTSWLASNAGSKPWRITFDLGANYNLTDLHVWNYRENAGSNRSTKDLTIEVADSEGGTFTSLGAFLFAQAQANVFISDFGASHVLSANNVRLVRFNITSTYGDATFAGLGEVEFNGVVVPEPGSLTLLLVAIAGGVLVLRRRR